MKSWILLMYKIPPKPTANRVYIWRKLKKIGALLWHDTVWILPAGYKAKEQFQWLATEITEMKGEVAVWEAESVLIGQEHSLIEQFQKQVYEEYLGILESLNNEAVDLNAASRKYQQALQKDYFQSELGLQVRERLLNLRGRPE
ncbi:Chromate resistance protein ChrB [Paenibacillus andongensis]|uniref:Chromate resistance protein ChrB n=1 Tax=Paenibacillus andongensis TaxID=2975482 RepID=UPI0021BA941A|nr:Chromate resistance protein ChrB [Paenibacillus andongensis]